MQQYQIQTLPMAGRNKKSSQTIVEQVVTAAAAAAVQQSLRNNKDYNTHGYSKSCGKNLSSSQRTQCQILR